ncbi:DUF2892 domain-containing protein [Defluviimonas aestuarii]|jgi:hypothetical protein|uniref:YgaP family membrane protein n=1 Tax=Albidovulum aestuarii TaxID=1130726 RepID=UPI00249BFA29|nr:DUF2892 domain-containing protein [Defluviimonas aestuarii]MDI3335952.1 DUF2892 domain-containing protein [Defluviimonas aestuarii]
MFKTNVGGIDRVIRILLGLALLAWWYFAPGMGLRWLPLVLGIVALGTGLMSTCPLYSLLGINTCPLKKA